MDFVVVESPFATNTITLPNGTQREILREDNIAYACACLRDCLVNQGEAPFASHLLYTREGILDDDIPDERTMGIQAGFDIGRKARRRLFYVDRGFTAGMRLAYWFAQEIGQECVLRRLGAPWDLGWDPNFSLSQVR